MTLLQRQIKAVEETLGIVVKECLAGKGHTWRGQNCPICLEVYGVCGKCLLFIEKKSCLEFAKEQNFGFANKLICILSIPADTPVIADFLFALLLYLKEQK